MTRHCAWRTVLQPGGGQLPLAYLTRQRCTRVANLAYHGGAVLAGAGHLRTSTSWADWWREPTSLAPAATAPLDFLAHLSQDDVDEAEWGVSP